MGLLESTLKTWSSLLFWPRGRVSASRLIVSNAVCFVLFLLLASHPAAAAGDELRVIAVHTGSAPRVSMVVEPPVTPPQNGSAAESCSVTIYGKPVDTTVTEMASGDLSVALVIDTASGLTSQELAAVQSGAAEFLLRLPDSAHTIVVEAADQPEVIAPMSEHRAEALSAISALRVGGSPATMAATMVAAQSLESAPPGPRAIIVYTQGLDEPGELADRVRLSQAVSHSEAVLNVIQTGTETLWPSVVDQAGGVVVTTNADDIVQSFADLAATLGEQYLVRFEAPGALPAVAQVTFQTGDQEYRTVVNLPDTGPAPAAPPESSEGSPDRGVPWLVAPLVAGLALTALAVFLHRARQRRPAYGGRPSTQVPSPATGAPPPVKAAPNAPVPAQTAPYCPPPNQPSAPTASLPDDHSQNDPQRQPPTWQAESRPTRRSLSAAIEGRRLARLILDSQPQSRPELADQRDQADNKQTEDPHTDLQAGDPAKGRNAASGSEADTKAESGRPDNPTEGGSTPAASIVFTGSGDGIVQLTNNAPGPAAVRIIGNRRPNHFKVRTLGTQDVVVVTTGPYEGVRPLDWDGGNSTGFQVTATGPWRIEVLPLSAMPTFDKSFKGEGDQVIHFTGDGLVAGITPNDNGRIYNVRTLNPNGRHRSIVNPHGRIDSGTQFLHVEAAGSWTLSIT
jgi:hypothetical protein